jgi:hypothetical protein
MFGSRKAIFAVMLCGVLAAGALGQASWQPCQSSVEILMGMTPQPALAPSADIKVNGEDSNVYVASTGNAVIDFAIEANGHTGTPVDIWVVLDTPGGYFTYDSIGPFWGWNPGLGNVYYSGPLADLSDTVLDSILPIGLYKVYLGIDTIQNGRLDMGAIKLVDSVDFEVMFISSFFEDFEDGIADGWKPDGPHWSVANGAYLLDCPDSGDFSTFYYPQSFTGFSYSADMRMVDTGNIGSRYERGLVFCSDGTLNNCYQVTVNNDGYVNLYLCVNSPLPMLLKSTQSLNVIQGVGIWNTVKVQVRNSVIDVFINGVLEFSVVDTSFTSGNAGLIGKGSSLYDIDHEYDNVELLP